MAELPKRFCNHQSCSEWAVDGGYCEAHYKAKRTEHDQRRGSASDRGYTGKWTKSSNTHKRNNPLCIGCLAVDVIRPVYVTDHIIPHQGNSELFWDTSNWQSSCAWHHDKVKQILERMWGNGQITANELRLDSGTAKRLTRELMGKK